MYRLQSLFNKFNVSCLWLVYFIGMFTLYTYTYIQLFLQVILIACILISHILKNGLSIKKIIAKNYIMFLLWYGLLVFIAFISKYTWSVYVKEDSNTLITLIRIFIMSSFLILSCDSKKSFFKILKSFILAVTVMGCIAIITTPVNEYFKEGDGASYGFGTKIGMHRNTIGAISVTSVYLLYYLKKNNIIIHTKFLSILLIFIIILTGSRGAYIQLLILFILYYLFCINIRHKVSYFIPIVLLLFIVFLAIRFIPIFYNNIYLRFENTILTIFKLQDSDGSTLGRMRYQSVALYMFRQKPILGYGLDGFYGFLDNNVIYLYLKPVYSHCNYAELASSFGLLGIITWYWMILYFGIRLFKTKNHWNSLYIIPLFLSLLIMDYARINWNTHITMYLYVLLFLNVRFVINEV